MGSRCHTDISLDATCNDNPELAAACLWLAASACSPADDTDTGTGGSQRAAAAARTHRRRVVLRDFTC
eukprot:superscaffoldBa00010270_g24622